MTTTYSTVHLSAEKRPPNSTGAFLFMALILVWTAIAVLNGPAGEQARNCPKQHGTGTIFREHNGNTLHFLCQSDMRDWFDVITEREDKAHFVEASAYAPDEQTLEGIQKWLRNIPRLASEFKGIPLGTPVSIAQ